ncbi:F-box/kelch-repeat protein [Trifolium repens]|nr:F-box/kelch-repeat protein [Trifolium repens]
MEGAIFPEEIMLEIISWLLVKHVMQLRCVNKFFNALIFDPHFVQMHLNKSTRNSQLALISFESKNHDDPEASDNPKDWNCSLITPSIPFLLQNQFTIFHHSDPYYLLIDFPRMFRSIVGSCNGLLCLFCISCSCPSDQWIYFWNPAVRKESKKFTLFFDMDNNPNFNFSFGYDNSTQTYKVVAFYVEVKPGSNPKSVVKIFSLGDNSWRDIQCLPVLPLYCLLDINNNKNDGVHLNGTINWFALHDGVNINIKSSLLADQCVILSLDLCTETYTKLLLPRRFDEVSRYFPKLVVLMDCLCFCHDFEETHFVIWQMKDFGVEDSWIQLFKISYEHFDTWMKPLPLYLSENGDTLVLANLKHKEAFNYNCRDNKVKKIGFANRIKWSQAEGYVESLVSTH